MVLLTPDRPHTINLISYAAAPEIVSALPRFRARIAIDGHHQLWQGHAASGSRPPTVNIGGRVLSIFDFAYLAQVDELWPHLRAAPVCIQPLCVAPDHLGLRRTGKKPYSVLLERDWDDLARRLYLTGNRRWHRHLRSVDDVGRIYEAEVQAAYELPRRNARLARSITFDAARISPT